MSSPMNRLMIASTAVLSALALAACATMNVDSFAARGLNLRQYRTYAWGPPDATSTGDPRLDNNQMFEERVRSEIEKALASRGFEKTTLASPDLLVHYHASFTQKVEARNIDRDYPFCETNDCGPEVFDAGTLFVDLVDPASKQLVWRGWAESQVDLVDSQQLFEARVDRAVSKILQRLPRKPS